MRVGRCEWVPGERLVARGQSWTLLGTQRGSDCVALRLSSTADATIRTLLSPFDRFEPSAHLRTPRVVRVRKWLHHIRGLAAGAHPAGTLRAAAGTGIRLLRYQLEPVLAVIRHGATRLLIADAVGLGKTVQAGLVVAEQMERIPSSRVLVLLPAGLREQWRSELARLFMLSTIGADSAWMRAAVRDRPAGTNPWALPGIYVASHDFVKQPEVLRPLEEVMWDVLVVDEAHAASSRSDRRMAVDAVARRSRLVLMLTATPHFDNPREHDALCAIGSVDGIVEPPLVFRRTREVVSGQQPRRSILLPVHPTSAEQRMHGLLDEYTRLVWQESTGRGDEHGRLAAIVLRKRALSSAASLAASVRRRMELLVEDPPNAEAQLPLPWPDEDPLEDEEPGPAIGVPGLSDAFREKRWLSLIAEAARNAAAQESKSRRLRRLLARVREPAIVFTEYRDTLVRLRGELGVLRRPLQLLHGGMSPAERTRVQREFNQSPAILLATDAASEGLNLHTQCRLVIHYELPWSISRLEQRTGRVDRLGQNRRVHEIGLVAAATAERLVLGPLLRRAREASARDPMNGLAATLTESHVADIVLGDGRATAATPPPVECSRRLPAALPEEASREVARLVRVRACMEHDRHNAVARDPLRPAAAALRRRTPRLPQGLILVYVLAMSLRGRMTHEQTIPITVPGSFRTRSNEQLRKIVLPFCRVTHPAVHDLLARAVRDALDEVVPVLDRVDASNLRRARLIRRKHASVARQLVQTGLFERRSSRHWRSSVTDDDDSVDDGPLHRPVCIELRLAAALSVEAR